MKEELSLNETFGDMTSDNGDVAPLPFGFVKTEHEPMLGDDAFDNESIAGPSGRTTDNIPNAIVEVVIPPHPNSLEAYQRISTPIVVNLEEVERLADLARPEDMRNENAKVKKETFNLPEAIIAKYINFFGLRSIQVPQDDEAQRDMNQTIRREFLSNEYGGSPQELLSRPKATKVAIHGHRLFVCPMTVIHPWAPQIPGQPGLIFYCPPRSYNDPWDGDGEFPCISGLQPGKWLYTGHCEWQGQGMLTKEEWLDLPHSVKRNWIAYIMSRPWSVDLRMSIRLRRELGREPSRREVEKAAGAFKKDGPMDNVTPEEIMEAFNKGKEAMRISGLICVRYDIHLQREFIARQARWYRNGAPGLTVVKKKVKKSERVSIREGPSGRGARVQRKGGQNKRQSRLRKTVESDQMDHQDTDSDTSSSPPAPTSAALHDSSHNTRSRTVRIPRRFAV